MWKARWIARHTSVRAELERGVSVITPDTNGPTRFIDPLVGEATRINEDDDREQYSVVAFVSASDPSCEPV